MSKVDNEFDMSRLRGFEADSHRMGWPAKFEAVLGLTATFFIGFAPVVITGLWTIIACGQQEWGLAVLSGVGASVTGWLAGRVAALAGQSLPPELAPVDLTMGNRPNRLRERRAFAVEMAIHMPTPHAILRPVLFLWWLSHFAAGLMLAFLMHGWLNHGIRDPTFLTVLIPIAFHLAFMIAANIYLTLAVAALDVDESTVAKVWKMRFSIDLLLTLVVGAVSIGM